MSFKTRIMASTSRISKGAACALALSAAGWAVAPDASIAQASGAAKSPSQLAKSISGAWQSRGKTVAEGIAAGYPIGLGSTGWAPLSAGPVENKIIPSFQKQKDDVEKVIASKGDVFVYQASLRPRPPLTEDGQKGMQALQAARAAAAKSRNPYDQCAPRNVVGVSADAGFGHAIELFDAGDHIGVVSEGGGFRVIHMGKVNAATYTPTYDGVSVGRWVGSKLVVVTTNFLGDSAEGWPMSADAKITDTIWSPDGKTLDIKTVYEDPKMLKEPMARMTYMDRASKSYEFLPVSCVETVQGAAEYAATFGAAPPD